MRSTSAAQMTDPKFTSTMHREQDSKRSEFLTTSPR